METQPSPPCFQVSNATAVYVRRPGVAKKYKAEIVCEGKVCDLALLTVNDDTFWSADLRGLEFEEVPELQVGCVGVMGLCLTACTCWQAPPLPQLLCYCHHCHCYCHHCHCYCHHCHYCNEQSHGS